MIMSVSVGHSDIDSLVLAVRDREARRLIGEAITAYRGGALRSAIMSTWIAVAYDIIAKARELAGQGEAAPRALVTDLDAAIAAKDKRKLQSIESELLDKANSDLELLAPHEYSALARLQEDRHLCAHPAFVVEDELFQPSPELVRAHIVHALQHLLIHAPLQGKSAIARFDADLLGPAFPATAEDIGTFLRARYLDRAKDVLVVNLIKAIIAAPFGAERPKYASKVRTLAVVLREIAKSKTAIYDGIMPAFVAAKVGQIQDDVLLSICPFLESDARLWDWMLEPDRMRIRRLLETADVESLKAHAAFDAFAIPPLSAVLLERFNGFDLTTQISVVSEHPRRELVQPAIDLYSGAGSFRGAEMLGQSVILPTAPFFEQADVEALLGAVRENDQIWYAGGTPDVLEQVFDLTKTILGLTREYWQAFVDGQIARMEGDASEYYAYPGLQQKLAENP
ncbi:hypothetical protein CX676_07790 [Paracoccus zhejiangensis]|uniref:Uncharacterized protein n=2 Tax=Paracoccus zhejiangensis TaxID=1077935 RepID=A0A2H5EXN5_9RHOB|nr:hypothetical protein CX676_07790 [Paracoccus zhejiangensis]